MPLLKPEHCTSKDYWNLPDNTRAELIDGQLYAMTPPSPLHQQLAAELTRILLNHIHDSGGTCRVFPAPFAVNLTADDTTWVEPDISIVCDPSKISGRGCEGAPDMVLEIVSPSSTTMDYLTKTARYRAAGVREYWIVDPGSEQTAIYRFEQGDAHRLETVPFPVCAHVGIFDGLAITVAELLK